MSVKMVLIISVASLLWGCAKAVQPSGARFHASPAILIGKWRAVDVENARRIATPGGDRVLRTLEKTPGLVSYWEFRADHALICSWPGLQKKALVALEVNNARNSS